MAIPFLNNINLGDNQLQNAKLHVTSSSPTSEEGQIYFHSSNDVVNVHDGGGWETLAYQSWVTTNYPGTVTSVAISGSDGIDVDSGSPITSSGTIALGLSSVPNSSLANSSITIGNSTISLGGTDTTLTGLTDIDLTAGSKTIFDGVGANTLTIGAGTTTVAIPGDLVVTGTTTTNNVETVSTSNGVIFEGNVADASELTLLAGTLTADRTVTLPDATGTVALTSDLHDAVTLAGSYDYITISGQTITRNQVDYNTDIANTPTIPTVNDSTITLSAGNSAITIDADPSFTLNQSFNETITISHTDTSSATSQVGSGLEAITQTVVDTYGHVVVLGKTDLTSGIDGRITGREYSTSIGDGSNTSYTVTHSLNSRDVIVQLYDASSYETVYADITRTTVDTLTVVFASAPTTNDIKVLVTKIG